MDADHLGLGAPKDSPKGTFSTTHWTVVLEAGNGESPGATEALDHLCKVYWYPLYVFVRREGHSADAAKDLTQEFLARFLKRKYISLADQSRGKFRNFLLRSLKHFLINEWEKEQAESRGGRVQIISWEAEEVEERYQAERTNGETPDRIYDKRWAERLFAQVKGRLREEYCALGKKKMFEALEESVWGEPTETSLKEIGAASGMSEGAVKVAAHRMRRRYRELLRAEVARTVAAPTDVEEELRYLVAIWRG